MELLHYILINMLNIIDNQKYKVKIRTHYGIDLHDYSTIIMTGKKLKLQNFNSHCIGHSIDTPADNVVSFEKYE